MYLIAAKVTNATLEDWTMAHSLGTFAVRELARHLTSAQRNAFDVVHDLENGLCLKAGRQLTGHAAWDTHSLRRVCKCLATCTPLQLCRLLASHADMMDLMCTHMLRFCQQLRGSPQRGPLVRFIVQADEEDNTYPDLSRSFREVMKTSQSYLMIT